MYSEIAVIEVKREVSEQVAGMDKREAEQIVEQPACQGSSDHGTSNRFIPDTDVCCSSLPSWRKFGSPDTSSPRFEKQLAASLRHSWSRAFQTETAM